MVEELMADGGRTTAACAAINHQLSIHQLSFTEARCVPQFENAGIIMNSRFTRAKYCQDTRETHHFDPKRLRPGGIDLFPDRNPFGIHLKRWWECLVLFLFVCLAPLLASAAESALAKPSEIFTLT